MESKLKVPYESDEQIAFVRWFKTTYPDVLIWATPNGGSRNPKEALKLSAEGVLAGVPDIFIPAWRIFIEMKRQKGGRVSPEQRDAMAYLTEHGYQCQVCYGYQDAKQFVLTLGK